MKRLKYLLPLIILLLVGCSATPKIELEKAILKTKNIKSTSINIDLDMEIPVLNTKMGISANVNGDLVNLDKEMKTHLNTNINFLVNLKSEVYSYIEDGYVHTYTKNNNKWKYTKTKLEKSNNKTISKDDLVSMLETFKDVKEVTSDKEGYTKLLVTLNKDSLSNLYKKYITDDKFNITIEKDVEANIYIKDGYISIIDMDLSNVIKNENTTLKITISLDNINKVKDFDIPEEVLKSNS